MPLDDSQLATLKADIISKSGAGQPFEGLDPTFSDDAFQIAAYYNAQADPAFYVFRTSVSTDDTRKAVDWSEVLDDVTPLKDIARWAFDNLLANGDFDASVINNREALASIFEGASYVNTRTAILAEIVRTATRGEELFAVADTGPAGGDGSASTAAAVMQFQGAITYQEVVQAGRLP